MTETTATAIAPAAAAPPRYTRTNPFPARMVVNRRLSGPESEKDTRHFELDLTGWGLTFEVGDSLAVYATNDPELVDEIIRTLGATGSEQVPRPKGEPTTFREALLRDYSITQPTPKFLRAIAERASAAPTLTYLLAPNRKQDLETYLWGMEIIDFLSDHPSARFAPEEFVGLLSKLQPRLYSVASSLRAYPDQVHFIVDVIRYESNGRLRKGVCSSFLAERADDVPVPVFPTVAKHFHLPADPDTPIIMIGPGTGVAPFRAYLQERKATGSKGKNWLFFGAQHERCDFAYGEEFNAYMKEGLLARLDCAWSRDQPQK
ncbi:MAG: sulfite reductase subunit alpha, partial [Verrucomicrobia bacterium]